MPTTGKVPFPVDDLIVFLNGDWVLHRRLVSLEPRQSGAAQGEANFRLSGDGLDYRETADVRFAGHAGRASREYRYRLIDQGCAEVFFADGRPFHRLDLRRGRWRVEHVCGEDVYRGSFRVLGPGLWVVRWKVRGPRKNLRITSVYERRR
ncbi:DUF6314 family protein [Acidihalobacter prosperus]